LEYDIAQELKKPVYVFICGDGFPYDVHEPEERSRQHPSDNRPLTNHNTIFSGETSNEK